MEKWYQQAALNCFRYLGFTSFAQVDQLTIPEYLLLMRAVRLRQADADYRVHQLAFQSFRVQAMKKSGKRQKPVFSTFRQFFDYQKAVDRACGRAGSSRFDGIGALLEKGES
ncbi:MAG TPA: hypothetical protein DDX51_01695 [Clostridiales bacterium]|nr:hypothetical protein [Clostridiales bacterium]